MESPPHDAPLLRDLALLYIALAFGADQDLNGAEVDVIARRLQEAQANLAQGTVLRAIKDALEDFTQPDGPERIERAARHLCAAVPPALRRRILQDLTDIGKADDRFLYAEADFIGRLAAAWQIEPDAPASGVAWSIFAGSYEAGAWTPLHDLALLYVTLAHRTDGDLSRPEIRAITEKIGEWMPDADAETLRRILHEVLRVYERQPEGRRFEDAVEAVRKAVPPHQRAAVLDDLRYIAEADGVVLVEERVMIEALAKAWEEDA